MKAGLVVFSKIIASRLKVVNSATRSMPLATMEGNQAETWKGRVKPRRFPPVELELHRSSQTTHNLQTTSSCACSHAIRNSASTSLFQSTSHSLTPCPLLPSSTSLPVAPAYPSNKNRMCLRELVEADPSRRKRRHYCRSSCTQARIH